MDDSTQISSGSDDTPAPARPRTKSKGVGPQGLLALASMVAIFATIGWLIVEAVKRAELDAHNAAHAYSALSLSRASIGDVGVFWGGYAAYAAACLFLFTWLARFPIFDSLQGSFGVALAAVSFVFVPLIFFAISVHISAGTSQGSASVVCGSWLYPSPSPAARCIGEFSRASRYGLTVAVAGILTPLGCMASAVLKENLSQAAPAQGDEQPAPEQSANDSDVPTASQTQAPLVD
jgi:hypothetical protein